MSSSITDLLESDGDTPSLRLLPNLWRASPTRMSPGGLFYTTHETC